MRKQPEPAQLEVPEDWTAKLNSEEFLQGWNTAAKESAVFPPDAEEQKSSRVAEQLTGVVSKAAILSKFLTNLTQPRVEAKSPLSKPADLNLEAEMARGAKSARPNNTG